MPILKMHNLTLADYKENKNVFYVYPDNYSLMGGDDIIKQLRNSDYTIPIYTKMSKNQPFIYERGMAMLDESMEKIRYLLGNKAIMFALMSRFYADLGKRKVDFQYEKISFDYVPKIRNYTPDFYLPESKIYIETKGRLTTNDRVKHLLIKEQHPDLDIRFVFVNANNKISRTSKTTYANW